MKCKRHPYESGPGVCAPCLRDRLLALIAASDGRSPERRRNPDPPPPHIPRSATPPRSYADSGLIQRFFRTPQVGPTTAAARSATIDKKFSLFSAIFGFSRSDEMRSSKSSSSWISHLISRKKRYSKSRSNLRCFQDRGMSPTRDHEDENDSACSSGYSTESSTGWRRPEPTPIRRFPPAAAARHGRGVSGFAVCLSPLVRPSMKSAVDLGISGDPRGAQNHQHHHHHHRRHVSVGHGSLVPSGSRKLTDYGRFR